MDFVPRLGRRHAGGRIPKGNGQVESLTSDPIAGVLERLHSEVEAFNAPPMQACASEGASKGQVIAGSSNPKPMILHAYVGPCG